MSNEERAMIHCEKYTPFSKHILIVLRATQSL